MRWLLLLCQFIPALANCATGKYLDQSVCKDCAQGRYQDETGQNDCKDCAFGKYLDEEGKSASTDCKFCGAGLQAIEYAYELKTSGTCDNYVTTAEEC